MLWQNIKRASLALFFILISAGGGFYLLNDKSDSASYYQINCRIYDKDLILFLDIPGYDCNFLSDGSIIAATETHLSHYDPYLNVIWSVKINPHHLSNLTADEKKILVLTSSYRDYLGERMRFDDLKVVDVATGKTLANWSSFNELQNMLLLVPWKYEKKWHTIAWGEKEGNKFKADYEYFHFNSIYEIPKNDLSDEFDFLKEGGIVSNSGLGLVLFFDQNLKLKHIQKIDDAQSTDTHDVQILKNGEMLFYRNRESGRNFSSIQKYDFKENKIVYSFIGNKDFKSFYSLRFGSVQAIDDDFLFTTFDNQEGVIKEVSSDGKTLRSIKNPSLDGETSKPHEIMRAKRLDLTSFLKNFKGS